MVSIWTARVSPFSMTLKLAILSSFSKLIRAMCGIDESESITVHPSAVRRSRIFEIMSSFEDSDRACTLWLPGRGEPVAMISQAAGSSMSSGKPDGRSRLRPT